MATLTLTIVSGAGTSTLSKTFSAGDATRIIQAFQKNVKPSGTQDDLTAWLCTLLQGNIKNLVKAAERVEPTDPVFS